MKKTIFSLACMMLSVSMFGQQALWEGRQPETAIVNPDKSVTIQVYAPDAHLVRLEGELVGTAQPMEKDTNGLWTFTTNVLAPDLYLYYLNIDGVRALDPGNSYVVRDIASIFNYVLVDDYQSQDVPHGSLQQVWYDAEGFNHGRRLTVYLPAGYNESKKAKYPVLYLLHGSGGDEQAWIELGRTIQILDNSIAAGLCQPMIVVMPNGNMSEDAAPGYGKKANLQPGIPSEHRMDGLYESRFGEIVGYIDSHYRTIPNAAHRAIAGLSMGGYHTYWIALNNPKMFHYIAPFSAVYHRGEMTEEIYQNEAAKQKKLWEQKPFVHIYIGAEDFLYEQNKDMRATLDSLGYTYTYTESTGGHQWKNWRRYLSDFIKEIF